MHRLLLLATLVLLVSLAAPSQAMADEHGDLADRMSTQWQAIERGVATGTIPLDEGAWLKRELRTVRIEAEMLRRKMQRTPLDEALLHARLDGVAETIRASLAFHSTPHAPPAIAAR